MKHVAAIILSFLLLGGLRAEVVFSNLNSNPSATQGYGYTQFAQRFTTVSAGTGLRLDLNIISMNGSPQSFNVELWSADLAGTNLSTLLASIGSGNVSNTDKIAVTSFDLTYGLAASTNYFVKIDSNANFGWVKGPSSSTALNSVFRYGVGNTNGTDNSFGGGMKVDVAVPEPGTLVLGGIAAACGGAGARWKRRRKSTGAAEAHAKVGEPVTAV